MQLASNTLCQKPLQPKVHSSLSEPFGSLLGVSFIISSCACTAELNKQRSCRAWIAEWCVKTLRGFVSQRLDIFRACCRGLIDGGVWRRETWRNYDADHQNPPAPKPKTEAKTLPAFDVTTFVCLMHFESFSPLIFLSVEKKQTSWSRSDVSTFTRLFKKPILPPKQDKMTNF